MSTYYPQTLGRVIQDYYVNFDRAKYDKTLALKATPMADLQGGCPERQ
jgi:hypothetical protein